LLEENNNKKKGKTDISWVAKEKTKEKQ